MRKVNENLRHIYNLRATIYDCLKAFSKELLTTDSTDNADSKMKPTGGIPADYARSIFYRTVIWRDGWEQIILIALKTFTELRLRFTNARHWLAVILCWVAVAGVVHAGELGVGDAVPSFSMKDQFGKEFKFEAGLRFLLLGFDMGTTKQANLKLADLGAGWLEKHNAVYILDIHTMPGIAKIFALPKMRKYPHRIVLAEDDSLLAPFPRKPERITVMVLNPKGKVSEIRYWDPATEALGTVLR